MAAWRPALLNAANEVAVEAFLAGGIDWSAIAEIVGLVVTQETAGPPDTLDAVLDADRRARERAARLVDRYRRAA